MKYAVLAGTLALAPFAATAGGFTEPAAPAPAPIAPAAPIGYDWSGFYGGAQIEYGDVEGEGPLAGEGTGALYGVFGGYRYDLGDFVIGAEIDLNAADIDLDDTLDGSLDAVYRIGVEGGFDAGPALIYGTAGYAYAEADTSAGELEGDGYFFGAGIDYLVTDTVTIGAEVLQHEFDDFDGTDVDVSATTFGINAAFRF
ncbi:outer membrane protein [Gymnodinialimonas ulvae]|uniref:outer membrane protein n=1 Tax=Gymnodinialimonas ulvae TaxID=3126504 RepID=UPI0030AB4381